jgi:hypothetical protein
MWSGQGRSSSRISGQECIRDVEERKKCGWIEWGKGDES